MRPAEGMVETPFLKRITQSKISETNDHVFFDVFNFSDESEVNFFPVNVDVGFHHWNCFGILFPDIHLTTNLMKDDLVTKLFKAKNYIDSLRPNSQQSPQGSVNTW